MQFRSVMQQIILTLEPLQIDALCKMRSRFPANEDRHDMAAILESMSLLLSGVTDQSSPVRPLHASFYDFLIDPARSQTYFVGEPNMYNLAFASLGILSNDLRFNICGLESSYLSNSEVAGLEGRINENIPPHLSYSCRFWAQHLERTAFDWGIAKLVEGVLGSEKLLFWLEALSLLGMLGIATDALRCTSKTQSGFEETIALAQDGIKFIHNFGSAISHSAPHLYISALPFTPLNTMVAKMLMPKFSNLVQVAHGGLEDWPAVQLCLQGHDTTVNSVAFSPDGKRIVSGSEDDTVMVWDAERGVQIGSPLEGHTEEVYSVAFSPDGKWIVSGSLDMTVGVWDAEGGVQVGCPLEGHTEAVTSVAFSPDGKRIVSGSTDKTVRIWDAERGVQIGYPLEEHGVVACLVCFSSNPSHAIHDTAQLLDGLQYEDPDIENEPVKLHSDGWVRAPKGRLLLWIPPSFWGQWYSMWTRVVIPRGSRIELDLSQTAHGNRWHECFKLPA
ncbi:hypothetical protein M404DRAFT_149210 [Pisolithus tinctorius Marx 270]|uniref:Uncharacterized protein n=1 Tax=Pisolithus tinctorius Marx 270 TaxID=870435 RepID=A0A0C3P3M0_PISTI|nr:hypothetical protein M404DRAFT_149210 [Pisolithus tinctorius Marx 270]